MSLWKLAISEIFWSMLIGSFNQIGIEIRVMSLPIASFKIDHTLKL
jgi:hypothetical protein